MHQDDSKLLVHATVGELRAAVRESLRELLDERDNKPPTLLTKSELARELRISGSSIDRLVRRGLPHVRAGEHRRYALCDVLAWLHARGDGEPKPRLRRLAGGGQ